MNTRRAPHPPLRFPRIQHDYAHVSTLERAVRTFFSIIQASCVHSCRATDINSLVPKKKGAAIVRGIERFLELFACEPHTIRIDLAVVTLSGENIKLVQYVPGIFSHE